MNESLLEHCTPNTDITLKKLKRIRNWKILVVDDEKDIHSLTSLLLKNLEFNNKGIKIYDAYTAAEAKKIIQKQPDIQLVLLDVVMETDDAGLEFVKYVREELQNHSTRIIIRTGQPGAAPQSKVFNNFDIDNYTSKTELTADSFSMLILSELKNYYKHIENLSSNSINEKQLLEHENKKLSEEISEHLQIEAMLKESEACFKSLLDTAVGWEYWITEKGKIQYSSPSCLKITGYKADDFIKNKISCIDLIHPDDIDLYKIHRQDEIHSSVDQSIEFRMIDKQGNEKVIFHTCQPVYDNEGNYVGRRVSNHDITKQKHREGIIKKSEENLRKLNRTKNQLFSVIAHDLKSPFLSILGFTEILSEEISKLKNNDLYSISSNINHSVRKVYELLENLLTWSRLHNNQIHINPTEIDIYEIVDKIFDLYKVQALEKNISLINNISKKVKVFADYFMVDTIIRNLVNNSVKFTKQNGFISINSESDNRSVKICVEDNGKGISLENQKKLFRDYNLHFETTTQKESGTGIGLLLCKEFIEKNSGKIEIHSEPGKGTKFCFTLPKTNTI